MTTKSESIPGCIFYPYIDRTTTYSGGAGLELEWTNYRLPEQCL